MENAKEGEQDTSHRTHDKPERKKTRRITKFLSDAFACHKHRVHRVGKLIAGQNVTKEGELRSIPNELSHSK